eukprot:971025-Prymnesium_polylepis.1
MGCVRGAAAGLKPRRLACDAELPYGLHGQQPRPASSGLRARRQRRQRQLRSSAGAALSARPPTTRHSMLSRART